MENKLPERLKKLRRDSELSQAKLGVILGVPQQTYDKWEQGKSQPDIQMLIRLATYFDVTVDYLIGKTNNFYHDETTATATGGNDSVNIAGKSVRGVNVKKK